VKISPTARATATMAQTSQAGIPTDYARIRSRRILIAS
jgi:hypothetical protein